MREQLLGFLLGALDAPEQHLVEQELNTDARIRGELDRLNAGLAPLRDCQQDYEAPDGLAEQTCDYVADQASCRSSQAAICETVTMAGSVSPLSSRWSLADLVVTASVIGATALLFFPAIATSRFHAEVAGCQYNLRQIGFALSQYSSMSNDYFPYVQPKGDLAFAGVYAPLLMERGHVTESRYFVCPASSLAVKKASFRVPTIQDLRLSPRDKRRLLRRYSSGSYGYHMGHLEHGRHHGTRNQARPYFALMSDAPSLHLEGQRTSNHGGKGQNILFEDCRVQFHVTCLVQGNDHVFVSDRGFVESGRHPDDSVIGFGGTVPVQDRMKNTFEDL